VAVTIVRLRSMFAVVMLSGIYSFLMASAFVILDAVDVAFTEAAVGAGIMTVLGLAALALTTEPEKKPAHRPYLPLLVVAVTGATLLYVTPDMPVVGDPDAPAQVHVAPRYLEESVPATTVPNVVTAVLASYRGFDTLGEVAVIFTAGIGVLLVLTGTPRPGRKRKRK